MLTDAESMGGEMLQWKHKDCQTTQDYIGRSMCNIKDQWMVCGERSHKSLQDITKIIHAIILLQTQICIHLHKRTSPFAVHSLLIERKLAPGLRMTRSRVPPTAGQKPYIGWSFWFWLTATQYMLYCFITRWAATPCKQLPWNHPFRHERACAEQKMARSLAQNPCKKRLQRLIRGVKSIYYRLM